MRLVSSFLPKAAIEVAVCSKYRLEVTVIASTLESCYQKLDFQYQYRLLCWAASAEILYHGKNA